jgi:thiol-disulfide isomerase/thioredoxin
MSRGGIAIIASLFVATTPGFGCVQEKDKASSATADFQAVVAEVQKLEERIGEAYQAAKTEKDKELILENRQQNLQKIAGRFLAVAEKYPKDPASFGALLMAARYAGPTATGDKAAELILQDHWDRLDARFIKRVGDSESDSPALGKILRGVIEKSKDRALQAQAMLSLAQHLAARADADDVKPADSEKFSKEAEKVLTELSTEKYADVAKPWAEEMEKLLFVARHLAIGRTAPDIAGEDAENRKMKLSDFRGKVVVLDFWASWCGPCMDMVPHEREIVKRLAGKPFALLGVNLDDDRETLKQTQEKFEISWPSFFDGRGGPISDKWNVQGIPAIFVIDPQGVIRYKGVRGKALDEAVDNLLKEGSAAK